MKFLAIVTFVGCLLPSIFGLHLFVGVEPSLNSKMNYRGKRDVEMSATPVVSSYHITSTITARYVSTSAVATLVNEDDVPGEASFTFQMTPGAFITEFIMIVDGVTYKAKIQERRSAERQYNNAVSKGHSAAQVSQDSDTSARFKIDLNIRGDSTVSYNLTYQELLLRDKGEFTHNIYIAPGQVTDLRATVNIFEPQGLTHVNADWEPLNERMIPEVNFDSPSTHANVVFNPSRQIQSGVSSTEGINGVLKVSYDVEHNLDAGNLLISNGYFVHHISPEGLDPAPKKVIFVIDVSASMWGPKMTQTTTAMVSILEELREIDQFNILLFSTDVEYWRQSPVPANMNNKLQAQDFVSCLQAKSATNLQKALLAANDQFNETDDAFPAIILLTDGRPNVGATDPAEIVDTVSDAIGDRVALFGLGIGPDVDDDLLEALTRENQGLYRKVFIDSSAAVQMCGFFEEVATPLLYHVSIRYQEGAVDKDTLTDDEFLSYLDGKELVVAGKVSEDFEGESLDVVVSGKGQQEDVELDVSRKIDEMMDPHMVEDFAERMWAFLTIKDCLKRPRRSHLPPEEQPDAEDLDAKALELSLKYSFVSPMASLLILKPSEVIPTERIPVATTELPKVRPLTPESPIEQTKDFAQNKTDPDSLPTYRAGGDPHFILDVPHSNLTICFDVQARNGTILSLVSDPVRDIYVSSKVIPVGIPRPNAARRPGMPPPSYLYTLGIQLGYYKIMVDPEKITVDSEIVLHWGQRRSVVIGKYNITVENARNMTITVGQEIKMLVVHHQYRPQHRPHLDFALQRSTGLSREVNGLIGEFIHKPITLINPAAGFSANGHVKGMMDIAGRREYVFKMKESLGHMHDCWWSLPEKYLYGHVDEYFLKDFFSPLRKISGE